MTLSICESPALADETLIPLKDASPHFPVPVSRNWLEKAIRKGTRGVRLETLYLCNKRYTSKEAIRRFIERTQNPEPAQQNLNELVRPPRKKRTEAELRKELARFGIDYPN